MQEWKKWCSSNDTKKDMTEKQPQVQDSGASDINDGGNREAPYGELCEARPRGEKQPWNNRKKVISFCLYLPFDQKGQRIPSYYLEGLVANVRLASLYYPDWVVRVYVVNLTDEQIRRVIAIDNKTLEVVNCPESSPLSLPVKGGKRQFRSAYSRFLAIDDPTVEYVIVRDLDTRPSIRELFAVNEWISSGLGFHAMHDHRRHAMPILAGLWGAKRGAINMTSAMMRALQEYPNDAIEGYGGDDQAFLAKYVWPVVKDFTINHDVKPGRCQQHGFKVCRKFLMSNHDEKLSRVGLRFKPKGEYIGNKNGHFTCSVDCKPSQEEWYTDPSTSNFI
jgi:hypothetical protein